MLMEYIVRSKKVKSRIKWVDDWLKKNEGLYPFKHIGIRVTDGEERCVYHLQADGCLQPISIVPCCDDEFSSGMGVKTIKPKEVDRDFVLKAIERMKRYDGKRYFPVLLDCDTVAGIGFNGYGWISARLLHRQFLVWACTALLVWYTVSGKSAAQHWDPSHPLLNQSALISAPIICIGYILYFLCCLNNTSITTSSGVCIFKRKRAKA